MNSFRASSLTLFAAIHVSVLFFVLGQDPGMAPEVSTEPRCLPLSKNCLQSWSFFDLENPDCVCGGGVFLPTTYEMVPLFPCDHALIPALS